MFSYEKIKEMLVLFQNGYTLKEIGLMYNITGERVRQLLYKHFPEGCGRRFGGIAKKIKPRTSEQSLWYTKTRNNVKQRGKWEWTIEREDFDWNTVCPILNIPIDFATGKISDNSPSLRRIDRTKGYIPGNVQLVSYLANRKFIWGK